MSWLQRHSSGVRHLLFYCNLMALLSPGATRQSPLYHMAIISAALFCDLLTLSTVTRDPLKPNKTHASVHPCAAPPTPIKENKRKANALRATPYLHAIRLFFLLPQTFIIFFFYVFLVNLCVTGNSHTSTRVQAVPTAARGRCEGLRASPSNRGRCFLMRVYSRHPRSHPPTRPHY